MAVESSIDYLEAQGVRKRNILHDNPLEYFIRSALAGVFLGMLTVVCFKIADAFYQVNSPVTNVMYALPFAIALVIIIYTGAELFTSNTMYLTVSTLGKKTTWLESIKILAICYIGNFVGTMLFVAIFHSTGIFGHNGVNGWLNNIVEVKMTSSFLHIFAKGILANWLVCLAVYLPTRVKSDGVKILMIFIAVFTFFVSGYEHSIANFSFFSLALLQDHPDSISIFGAIHNIIPATLGNIVGGGFFVGAVFYYLERGSQKKTPTSEITEVTKQAEVTRIEKKYHLRKVK